MERSGLKISRVGVQSFHLVFKASKMDKTAETVFIIDDDRSVRRSLSLFLTASDLHVETYCSSEEYLAREQFEGPGCILLDVNLEGKSGLDLQHELISCDSKLPIIFITGLAVFP